MLTASSKVPRFREMTVLPMLSSSASCLVLLPFHTDAAAGLLRDGRCNGYES